MELPSLTSSGSVQSHMSTSISKQRLRLHSSHSDAWEPPLPVTTPRKNRRFSDLLTYCDGWNAAVWLWYSLSNVYLRWLLVVYMCFSLVFISMSLYTYLDDILEPNATQEDWFISSSQRLSRIISYYPTPTDFEPFVLRGTRPDNLHAPTACCSCTDAIDVTSLMNWTRQWNGPVSIVMTTANSSARTSLLHRLEPLKIFPHLSLHLLPKQDVSPNTVLNLARFFALTSHVVLFPAELPSVLSLDVNAAAAQYVSQNGHIPAILTGLSELRFPMPPLSPMIISQDYPVWCPERFFFSHSRSLDWEECLWRTWLEDRGRFGHLNISVATQQQPPVLPTSIVKNRNKLTSRYRAETCDLLQKRQMILDSASRAGKKQLQWIKTFCRQTIETSLKT